MPRETPEYDFLTLDRAWLEGKPGQKWRLHAPRLPAWVADMDFRPAPAITDHLLSVIESGDLGYPRRDEHRRMRAVGAFAGWMSTRHGWDIDTARVREWDDVVQAVQAVLHVTTRPGDGVVVHVPAYTPFFDSIEQTGCRVVPVPALIEGDSVTFDHDELDRRLSGENARVFIVCNPHNPTGRVFTRAELERIVEIARRHDLLILSDEIHADLVHDGRTHVPVATIDGAAVRTFTVTSASKSFNLAGLRYAVSHCGADWVEERLGSLPHHLFGAANIMGAEAAWAAWTSGAGWLDAVRDHLGTMRDLTHRLVGEHLPGVRMNLPEATYLAWLDCTAMPFAADPHGAFAAAGVELKAGAEFGAGGEGHVRLNFATSPEVLGEIVTAMAGALTD